MTCGVKADRCGVLVLYIITFAHLELAPDAQVIPYIIYNSPCTSGTGSRCAGHNIHSMPCASETRGKCDSMFWKWVEYLYHKPTYLQKSYIIVIWFLSLSRVQGWRVQCAPYYPPMYAFRWVTTHCHKRVWVPNSAAAVPAGDIESVTSHCHHQKIISFVSCWIASVKAHRVFYDLWLHIYACISLNICSRKVLF